MTISTSRDTEDAPLTGGRAIVLAYYEDVPSDIEARWHHSYDTQRIPSRLSLPGFRAARRFEVYEGQGRFLTLYELDDVGAVASDAHRALERQEQDAPEDVLGCPPSIRPRCQAGTYRQIFPDTTYEIPDTGYFLLIAHDIPSTREEEFSAWYNTEHIPTMFRVPGFVTARRYRLYAPYGPELPGLPSNPQFLTIYDLENRDVLKSQIFLKLRESPWTNWVRTWYTHRLRIQARLIARHVAAAWTNSTETRSA